MFNRLLGIAGVLALLLVVAFAAPQRGTASGTDNDRIAKDSPQTALAGSGSGTFQPVQITVPVFLTDGNTLGVVEALTVPAHRRFVLEDLSVRADVPAGQTVLEAGVALGGPTNPFVFLPVSFTGHGASNNIPRPDLDEFHGGRPARGYAEAGYHVDAYAFRNDTAGGGTAFVSLTGYLTRP